MKFLITILIFNFVPWVTPQNETSTIDPSLHGPQRPPWTQWVTDIATVHLLNMTEELVKDMAYKMKHAEKVKESLGVSISFELGSVAAGMQERFYRMLSVYRKYANMRDFKAERWQVRHLMNAYHIIQGDYNEIRHEKSLYHDIVQHYETTSSTMPWYMTARQSSPKRRQAMTWRPYQELP